MALATPVLTVHDARSLATTQSARFNMVAFHWRGTAPVRFRVRFRDGWSPWRTADADTVGVQHGWHIGNLDWVGTARAVQTEPVRGVLVYTVWSPTDETAPQRRLQIANAPPIIPRLSWGADESIRRHPPRYAPSLKVAFVHHTAGTNNYTRAQSAAIVRGIEIYHVKGNGWDDIGYNFLVDKYGQVFEGRYGGIDRNVIGAHTLGFNDGTVGVALIGDYTSTAIPAAAKTALEQLLAWRLDLAHVDPLSLVRFPSGGNSRYPAGTSVLLRAISGHRDAYFTDCPGNAAYAELPAIAKAVAALGGPKIYAPLAKTVETQTRITATLSAAIPWTVTITSSSGAQVAQGTGTGTAVDWTWDASTATPDKYTWTIAAGSARTATGTLGATSALALQKVVASPAAAAPGQTVTVAYTLTAPAVVSAALANAAGQTVSTLLSTQKPAGAQTLAVTPPPDLPKGQYSVVLTAASGAKAVTASAPFVVDDILVAFVATPLGATVTLGRAPSSVTLQVLRGTSAVASPVLQPAAGSQTTAWPSLPDGSYTVALTVSDDVGAFTQSQPLTVDTTPPKVTVLSYKNLRFRVNEPATLTLVVGTAKYIRHVGKPGATTQFWLKTKPAAYTLLAADAAGNVARVRYRK
jgi:methionine-rich copper-binding protein CopC